MIVEKGGPNDKHSNGDHALDRGVPAFSGIGKGAGQRRAGLIDDEECSDEDNDDDIPGRRQSTSCHLSAASYDSIRD